MEGNIKISVVVPIYGCEKYLADCLDSLISQTYTNWEAYCVDDGSKDKSGEILDEYAKKDSRIIALHKTNGGEHSARNYALDRIKAGPNKWIAFVDGDDYVSPFMFEHLVNILQQVNDSTCQYMRLYCQRTPHDISENKKYQELLNKSKCEYFLEPNEYAFRLFDNDGYFADGHCGGQISSAFIHSKLIDRYHFRGPEDMRVLGDQVFTMKCANQSPYIVEYKVQDYFYRYNPTSLLHTTKDTSEYIIKCVNYVYSAFKDSGMTEVKQHYMINCYIPRKFQALMVMKFKCKNSKTSISQLDKDIKVSKCIKTWKCLLLYLYLLIFRRL